MALILEIEPLIDPQNLKALNDDCIKFNKKKDSANDTASHQNCLYNKEKKAAASKKANMMPIKSKSYS